MNTQEKHIFRKAVYLSLGFTFLLWVIKGIEWSMKIDLGYLGILPRRAEGLTGVLTGPLVHGDLFHLLSNTFPVIFLGVALFYFYDKIATEVFAWIYISTGLWVWAIAREAYHIGISGVIYGVAAFIFFSGIFRKNNRLMALSIAVVVLYGGMVYGIIPSTKTPNMSWESHLLGAMSGVLMALFFRKKEFSSISFAEWDNMDGLEATYFEIDDEKEDEPSCEHDEDEAIHFTYTFVEKEEKSHTEKSK